MGGGGYVILGAPFCNGSGSLPRVIPLLLCGLKLSFRAVLIFFCDMSPQWDGMLRFTKTKTNLKYFGSCGTESVVRVVQTQH